MNIICYGDSNTYGYDPRSWLGDPYDPNSRWVDILAATTGWSVCNLGQNGRAIPSLPPAIPRDTDLLILMLGTNDLLQGRSPAEAASKLERFLTQLPLNRDQILLIAPPPLAFGDWVPNQELIDHSHAFAQFCQVLAERLGIPFADAGNWNITLAYDGVHFTPQGHRAFAHRLLEVLAT